MSDIEDNDTSTTVPNPEETVKQDPNESFTRDTEPRNVEDIGETDEIGASENLASGENIETVENEESNTNIREGASPTEEEVEEKNEDENIVEENLSHKEENPPVLEESPPVEETDVPHEEKEADPAIEDSNVPIDNASAPAEPNAPDEERDAPAEETDPAIEDTNVPIDNASAPAEPNAPDEERDAPAEEADPAIEDTNVPIDNASAPAEPNAPDEERAAHAEEAAAPPSEKETLPNVPTENEAAPPQNTEKPKSPTETPRSPKPATEPPEAAPLTVDDEERVELPKLVIAGQPPPIGSPPLVKDIEDHVPQPGMDTSAQTRSDMPGPEDATATVKLLLMPSGQTVTKTLKLRVTFGEVVEMLGTDLRMPPAILEMLFNGKIVENNFRLEDYGIEANGTVAFEVNSKDPQTYPMREFVPRDPLGGMADVITVRIQMDDNTTRDIVVEIERTGTKKPFLGGYRHKRSGTIYHHATMQTNPKVRNVPFVERYSRDTQTWEGRHCVQQTFNTTSTQMTKPGVFITNATDKLIIPCGYETADAYRARILAKVIVLQRYLRGWLAKRYVNKLRQDKLMREEYERMEDMRKRNEKEDRVRKDFQRRMNPKSKEDFDLLYSALEKWRQEELARINSTMRGAERKAALYLLLEQETDLIAAIDRHQLDANIENKDKGIQRLLSKAAASKKWRNTEGKLLEVDTPYTLRGKELLDIYNSLSMRYLTQDERLDVLLTLKHTVKEHDCKLTQEIVELIDREADLLMRGVKEDNLAGLRKRITTLFLQYCKTPLFNPEMARLLKVPQDPSVLRQDIHYCVSCGRYLQSTEFSLGIKSTGIGRCRRCLRQDNLARTREDQSLYKYLLQDLQRREETFHDNDRIAFLIEEDDVRYLVDNIWEGMSVLSSWNDLVDLELVRWNYAAEWSPWNTALLTKDEAEAHRKLVDVEKAYGSILVHRVKQKHVLAKNYFHKLKHMVEKMRIMELELENVRQTTK